MVGDQRRDARPQVGGGARGDQGVHPGGAALEPAVGDLVEQRDLALDVAVDRADGEPGALGDLGHRQVVEATVLQELLRGVQERLQGLVDGR